MQELLAQMSKLRYIKHDIISAIIGQLIKYGKGITDAEKLQVNRAV